MSLTNDETQLRDHLIQLDLRVEHIEKSIERVATAIESIARHDERVMALEKTVESHAQRLSTIENNFSAKSAIIKSMQDHVKNDTPIDVHIGQWSTRILYVVGMALGAWLLQNLPKIMRLIEGVSTHK